MSKEIRKNLKKILLDAILVLVTVCIVSSIIGSFIGSSQAHTMFTSVWFGVCWVVILLALVLSFVLFPSVRRRLGPILIHGSIILIITGALIGSWFGHRVAVALGFSNRILRGSMIVTVGEEKDEVAGSINGQMGVFKLPFKVRLKDFSIEYYEPEVMQKTVDDIPLLSITLEGKDHFDVLVTRTEKIVFLEKELNIEIVRIFNTFRINSEREFNDEGEPARNPALLLKVSYQGKHFGALVFAHFQTMYLSDEESDVLPGPHEISFSYTMPSSAPRGGMIKDYISHLQIIENRTVVKEKKIQVNDPLHYKGYFFYQASYDPDTMKVSYLDVVSDRGWYFFVMPGFIMLVAGVFIQCWGSVLKVMKKEGNPDKTMPAGKAVRIVLMLITGFSLIAIPVAAGIKINSGKTVAVQYLLIAALWIVMLSQMFYGCRLHGAAWCTYTVGFVLTFSAFVVRWATTGHIPLQHMFEVMLTLSMVFYPLMFFLRRLLGIQGEWLDPILHSIIIFPAAFIFSPYIQPLPPALQSGYFIPHVSVYLLSYVLMAKAFTLACQSLVSMKRDPDLAGKYEHNAYITIALSFPLLTSGLILGAAWAQTAWGDYWGWDPKELWSLSTWLMYIIYFHYRYKRGGRSTVVQNILIILGFAAVVITLTWVNLSRIFSGLHNYA